MIKTVVSKLSALRSASANFAVDLTNGKDFGENLRLIKDSGIFDLDFYSEQLNGPELTLSEAISHYLNVGAENNLDPHPLFDTAYYIKTNKDINFKTNNPLAHFLTHGWREDRNPHPLFDVQYYLDEYKDVRRERINPLVHFIHFGAAEDRNPCEFFDSKDYKKKVQELNLRTYFTGYLTNGKTISFSRRFKTIKIKESAALPAYLRPYVAPGTSLGFLRQFKTTKTKKVSPHLKRPDNVLLHFMSQGARFGLLPFSSFELLYDLQPRTINYSSAVSQNKAASRFLRIVARDLTNLKSLPARFASFGRQLTKSNLSKEKLPLLEQLIQGLTFKKNTNGFMQSQSTILLVSHQAAYTGSPMLLLQIARELSARGCECLIVLEQGGALENEFSEVAHLINLKYLPDRYKRCGQYLSLLFDDLSFNKPQVCLLNSLETGHYAKSVAENEIKIISLVHEIVDSYSTRYLQDVFDRSQTIIFPAKFVQSFAHNKLRAPIKSSRELIIPNALLEKDFGAFDRAAARKLLRQEINASAESLVVLACGSPDLRKGIDFFVVMAKMIIAKQQQDPEKFRQRPVHFVWVGAGKIEPYSAHYYIHWDLRQENLQSQIHLLAPRKDLRPAFRGADVFVLPSRQDPFPIVAHNAMACELPIVAFEGAGGMPEMIAGGGACIVSYGDILSFTQAVEQYLIDDQRRLKEGQLNAPLVAERFRFSDYFFKLEAEINALRQ